MKLSDHPLRPAAQQSGGRFAELDGLRALAVLAVILFHCDVAGLANNGLYGVDVFFAISGFIITAMLAKEVREHGDFRFRSFYFRRLKRLLPPVLALLPLGALTVLFSAEAFAIFRADVPAALAYMSNVWQIDQQQSYFDNAPRILRHLWSLAVEEQFYVLWPPLAYFGLTRCGARRTGLLAFLLALASSAWMWRLFELDSSAAGINRVYLGTDTHAMGMLAGAALACWWDPWSGADAAPASSGAVRTLTLAALGALAWMVCVMDPTDPANYRGSFLAVPLLTGVLAYGSMSDRDFFLSRALRCGPVQWLGTRSYSLYLVHWLVFVWLRLLAIDRWPKALLLLVALTITAALAELLFRWVELPSKRATMRFLDERRMGICVVAYLLAANALLLLYVQLRAPTPTPAATLPIREPLAAAAVSAASAPGPTAATAANAPAPAAPDAVLAGGDAIYAIGDSVLLGAREHLLKSLPGIHIDAGVGRQASEGLKVIRAWRRTGARASTVLVHLGTNGYINEAQYREMLGELADRSTVINVHAERRWTAPNNAMIARLAADFPNVRLIDWHAIASGQPRYFVKDGIHLTPQGIAALDAQIQAAIGAALQRLPPSPMAPTPACAPLSACCPQNCVQ